MKIKDLGKKSDYAKEALRNSDIRIKSGSAFMRTSLEILTQRNEIEEEASFLLDSEDKISTQKALEKSASNVDFHATSLFDLNTPDLP